MEKYFYTVDELRKFLHHLKKGNIRKAYVLFRLLAYSGMRNSEALALTWEDIFFNSNTIAVYKSIAMDVDNKLYVKSTKTKYRRDLKMDDKTCRFFKIEKTKKKIENKKHLHYTRRIFYLTQTPQQYKNQ